MMIALTLVCTLNTFILGLSLKLPKHFYNVEESESTVLDNSWYSPRDVDMSPGFPFLQGSGCTESECGEDQTFDHVTIHKNGMIHLGKYYSADFPSIFPQVSKPGIAPFWAPLNFEDHSMVIYQKTTERRLMKLIEHLIVRKFKCAAKFKPSAVLIVTWFRMIHVSCETETNQEYCDCLLSHTEHICYCRHLYSLSDYCNCRARGRNCPCTAAEMNEYGLGDYCYCLAKYNDEWCDCLLDRPDYSDYRHYCECMRRRNHHATCECVYDYSFTDYLEDLCYCEHKGGLPISCYCYYLYSVNFCGCLIDFENADFDDYSNIAGFSDYDFSYDFCDCVTTNEALSSCFCSPNIDKEVEYCTCLSQYESFLERRGANHSVIHGFCLCMVNANDPVQCGCENCPSTRSLDNQIDDFSHFDEKRIKRDEFSYNNEELNSLDFVMDDFPDFNEKQILPRDTRNAGKFRDNTFQTLLITDGKQSYVMFNYGSIDVTTDDEGRFPVTVGIGGKGNDEPYFNHPLSQTKRLLELIENSNVGASGRWMYRVDGESVQEPQDCY